jgi:hypothetical protein
MARKRAVYLQPTVHSHYSHPVPSFYWPRLLSNQTPSPYIYRLPSSQVIIPENRCVRLLVKKLGRVMPESVVREELELLDIHVHYKEQSEKKHTLGKQLLFVVRYKDMMYFLLGISPASEY